jgi:glutamate---cysteine ligase / carboxylate-amine ligase
MSEKTQQPLILFNSSPWHTLGVEIELPLVDAKTMALRSAIYDVLPHIPDNMQEAIKPELMQSYIEINSGVCETVAEAGEDIRAKLRILKSATEEQGLELAWTSTHAFSGWRDQIVTRKERYTNLVDLLQDTARQIVTFGLHVHVGVDSGDKAVMICDRLLRYLPVLLAISCNSPFWEGRDTGLSSWRTKIMNGLPTAGLPPLMRNWSEYVWLVNHLVETGYIDSMREIWWDMRPHHRFGTVEIRICDLPGCLDDALALAAFIQCLVKGLSDQIDQGTYQHDCHPMLIRQNKWRASRYGLEAQLVNSTTHDLQPVRQTITDLIDLLQPEADELQCADYLEHLRKIIAQPNWSQRQLQVLEKTGDHADVVRFTVNSAQQCM